MVCFVFSFSHAAAQTNLRAGQSLNAVPASAPSNDVTSAVRAEQTRAVCLEGRRCVCGRVLKVLPDGLLVESGYPSLLRKALHGAWHLPGTVVAARAANLVESHDPDSLCVGTVFLTDLPKGRGHKSEPIKIYDYVVLHSYPAGEYTYTSVGNIHHTVRRFAGGLESAVNLTLQSEQLAATRH
jgi:hypothetical protein